MCEHPDNGLGHEEGVGSYYLGGRSGILAWLSPLGIGAAGTTRRHEESANRIVANPRSSITRHVIGAVVRAQSGQGIP